MATEDRKIDEPDPDSSPFETGSIAAMPYAKDSVEARAIERIIARAEREQAERARAEAADSQTD
jgi:hypothetical protein